MRLLFESLRIHTMCQQEARFNSLRNDTMKQSQAIAALQVRLMSFRS
jgi:hypothetical protein